MAKLRLAYGKKVDIESSIEKGDIPPGTVILTEDSNEMYFYNLDCTLCAYSEKYRFNSMTEAESWISNYTCKGSILSVHENDECNLYVVDYNNDLIKINKEQVQADWAETDPTSPAYIKNKPNVISADSHYIHTQSSANAVWEVVHNLDKYPSVTVVDSSGNLVIGDVRYLDENNLKLTFNGAFSGECYCN